MKQPTAMPTQKVTAAAIAGAVSVLLVYLLNQYAGQDLGVAESQAITALLAALAGYMKEDA